MLKLAVLISNAGTGTNLQAIINSIEMGLLKATVSIVVSSSKDAYGLIRAKKHNIPTFLLENNEILENILTDIYKVDYIVLAGWKKIISKSLINSFQNKILNLHPGIIPDKIDRVIKNPDGTNGLWNRGKLTNNAIQNFLSNKSTYAGSTVHYLSNIFDFGIVLARCFEKINYDDTVESLYSRLKIKENEMYVKTLIKLSTSKG